MENNFFNNIVNQDENNNNSNATNKMISEYIKIGKNRISNLTKIIKK